MIEGLLVVNADDWGRDRATTDRIAECVNPGGVSAVSAMVFMEDSERAAVLACERGIDAGLHLNFTTAFSAPSCPIHVREHQRAAMVHLRSHRLAQVVFHPGLHRSFEYLVKAQVEQYGRLYGVDPARIDGHHHMHLCANVLVAGLLPAGTLARRSFSFLPGEKGMANRAYRRLIDRVLARRHRLVDFLFSLPPLAPAARLQRIFSMANRSVVELETHPVRPDEYRFLRGGEIIRSARNIRIAPPPGPPRCDSLAGAA